MEVANLNRVLFYMICVLFIVAACRSSREMVSETAMTKADITPDALADSLFSNSKNLTAVSGKAKALISQPENTDRASITFVSNGDSTLIEVKNRIGIDGGLLLVTKDSILLYNKIDNYVKKVHRREGSLPELNGVGAINIIDLLRYRFSAGDIDQIFKSEKGYLVQLKDGNLISIDQLNFQIAKLSAPQSSSLPYTSVVFEGYTKVDGFLLPRKLTIISKNRSSKMVLLINNLEPNPKTLNLTPDYPEKLEVQHL